MNGRLLVGGYGCGTARVVFCARRRLAVVFGTGRHGAAALKGTAESLAAVSRSALTRGCGRELVEKRNVVLWGTQSVFPFFFSFFLSFFLFFFCFCWPTTVNQFLAASFVLTF